MSKQSTLWRAAAAAAAYGDATDAVDQAAAEHLAVNHTDLRILGVVLSDGPLSAGALSAAVELSPAATTEAVQRLVGRGMLVREVDPADRRRAVIAPAAGLPEQIKRIYDPVRDDGLALLGRYTQAELALIVDFLDRGRTLQLDAAARIRATSARPAP